MLHSTRIVETHSGETVREIMSTADAFTVVEEYVARGFDLASTTTGNTVILRSGRAAVHVTKVR